MRQTLWSFRGTFSQMLPTCFSLCAQIKYLFIIFNFFTSPVLVKFQKPLQFVMVSIDNVHKGTNVCYVQCDLTRGAMTVCSFLARIFILLT